jgi:hypothetical protein
MKGRVAIPGEFGWVVHELETDADIREAIAHIVEQMEKDMCEPIEVVDAARFMSNLSRRRLWRR